MTPEPRYNKTPMDKGDRTMIKAFTFAGTIMGLGLFGLVKAVILLAATLGWIRGEKDAGPFYLWLLAGAGSGLVLSWLLVKTRRRS